MAMKNSIGAIFGLLVLGIVFASPAIAITCQEAVLRIMPCQAYLTGNTNITPFCCGAAQSLNSQLRNKADRKAVCECFKKVGPTIGVKVDKARSIPKLCRIKLTVPIDYSANCNIA